MSRPEIRGIIASIGHRGRRRRNVQGMIRSRMLRRIILSLIAGLVSMGPVSGVLAREITDATGARIALPDRVGRVMAAGPNAAVVLHRNAGPR